MNVIMLSNFDYGGSGYKISQAVKRVNPDINIQEIVAHRPRFNYATGILLTKENHEEIKAIIKDADIIHYKGDDLPTGEWNGISIPKNKPVVITLGGSGFRRHGDKRCAKGWHPIEDYIKVSNIRTTITPDLNYPELKGIYTPTPIDSTPIPHQYSVGVCKSCGHQTPLVLCHSPSTRSKKGTDMFILKAVDKLQRRGVKFVFDLIEKVPHAECVIRKKESSIFIDNVCPYVGAFGNSGLEAMQYGIPTIASISQMAIDQSNGLWNELPIINCQNKDDVYLNVKHYFENIDKLKRLSLKTKIYTDKYHSYEATGKMWREIYEKL
jgi:hypothetical protein